MTKIIETLVTDIYEVLKGNGGWNETYGKWLGEQITSNINSRFSEPKDTEPKLRPSMMGSYCDREIWYKLNLPMNHEPMPAESIGTFIYGDLAEQFVIALAKAAGHKVECIQEPIEIHGIQGTADAVIDGMLVDVKSASGIAFNKFRYNQLKGYWKKIKKDEVWVPQEKADSFGYIGQLSTYLAAFQEDDRVVTKDKAAFLAINKERFKLHLDVYDLSEEVAGKKDQIERLQSMVSGELPDERLPDIPKGESGNRVLDTKCSYCGFKKICWPELRTFVYSSGPVFFTHVEEEPSVTEV